MWMAFEDGRICGYIFEFDKRTVHTHGKAKSMISLLDCTRLDEYIFVIEPHHLEVVKKLFEPIEALSSSTEGVLTRYLVLKVSPETFQAIVKHPVKKLGDVNLDEVLERVGEEYREGVINAISGGVAYGAYYDGSLGSVATVPEIEILNDLALIRGLYTVPSYRGKGLATSACSALVEELLSLSKEAMLWVAMHNIPARKVYRKIGFKETGHILLGFKGKRL